MKQIAVMFSFYTLCALNLQAQTKIFNLAEVDEAPFIIKCADSLNSKECFTTGLNEYIHQNIDIMKLVDHRNLPGKAYVQFIVTEEAVVRQVNVRTRNKFLKEEALRLFADLKIEHPARKNSKNVAIQHVIPITFNTEVFKSYKDFERNGKKQ
ncbi:hypothetical protein [Autumnicola musiva]|uniref:TonB C-terminal domain-containing protein n=1 Tax=Autumnicola musiva TaxID=3075589 RepID=A0ABU3D163_9FLAO|nr:hypothetical protein [Zunongwangia sp. F117]MDT0675065.1 hypothetical protein [Zunongwangia sp. F117]